MKIIHNSCIPAKGIAFIEGRYNAKYICDSCLKGKYGYVNFPCAFFYTEEAHPEGSNYFAVSFNGDGKPFITDGICIIEQSISGVVTDTGDIIYSRYRHDYVSVEGTDIFIDGGRDYLRCSADAKVVEIKVIDDELKIVG